MYADDFGNEYNVKTFPWGYFIGAYYWGVGLVLEE